MEVLELFASQPDRFDLVITDMTMSGLTGDKLAQKLMEIRTDLPVILCTGFSARINEEKALAVGIRAFVTKPVLQRQIAETIRMVLAENSGS
jgi:CheY-like chemotaxis protein